MIQTKYLIIGGGIAGTNACEIIRQKDPTASIMLVTDEKERLYSRVLLPQYLKGTIPSDRLFLKKPDFYANEKITFWSETEALEVDEERLLLKTTRGDIQYEKLLIACGCSPIPWAVPGSNLGGVVNLRTISDAEQIKACLQTATNGVIVGGGFIALELLTTFIRKGLKTTLIVREPSFFSRFLSPVGGELVAEIIKENGAEILLEDEIAAVGGQNQVEEVTTKKGKKIKAQIVGVGIGIRPNLTFLDKTQIKRSPYIETNEYLQTNVANIWAAGDVVSFKDTLTGRQHNLGNWANAADQGLVAGLNMVGQKELMVSASSYSINFFNSSISVIGDPDRTYATEVISRGSYEEKALGELFFRDDFLLGATLVGLPADRGPIGNLIKMQVKIADKSRLKDLNFSLNSLLHV